MGYNFSMINYDTIANGVQGSMNLFWNQAAMHSSVYPSLFMTPTMNFGSFSPYSVNLNNNWLLDPGFALNNAFNQFGMQCPWTMGCGLNLGNNSGSTGKTDEELDAEEKKKELNKIISELISAKILTSNDKKKIDNAAKEAKEAGNDLVGQYEAAKAKFDELISGKENAVKTELLEKGDKLKLEDGTTILAARKNLGIGENLTALDTDITAIENIVTPKNILEYIEEFQNQHGKNIFDKINSSTNQSAKEKSLNKLASTLMTKARAIKSKLDDNSKQALQSAIDNLENIGTVTSDDTSCSIPSGFKTAFETLYAMTRIAEATYLDSQITKKYGEYSNVFNAGVFKEEVVKDLGSDGYRTDFSITIDENYILTEDVDDLSPEEQQARSERNEAIDNNNKELNKALAGLDLYKRESVTVNINGQNVNLTKLVPTDIYENLDSNAKVYYYDSATGKYTEADSSGNYDATAESIDIATLQDKIDSNWNVYSEQCLYDFVRTRGVTDLVDGDSFDINHAYVGKGSYKTIAGYNHGNNKGTLDYALNTINEDIDTIVETLKTDSFFTVNVINNASEKMKEYYRNVIGELKEIGAGSYTNNNEKGNTITRQRSTGDRTRESYVAGICIKENDNDAEESKARTAGYDWNYKKDSGIVVRCDKNGDYEYTAYINTYVLINKFEYFLNEELKSLRN